MTTETKSVLPALTPEPATCAGPNCALSTGSACYARRPTEDLGEYYSLHVDAMTREGLHSKSAIAAELAWRDREIDQLRAIFPKICEALGNGSRVTADVSLDFLELIPREVALRVNRLSSPNG